MILKFIGKGAINIGGLGIHLVKEMMDDIGYQRVADKNKLI